MQPGLTKLTFAPVTISAQRGGIIGYLERGIAKASCPSVLRSSVCQSVCDVELEES